MLLILMAASDVAMGMDEFVAYYKKNKSMIKSARAYDAAGRRWLTGEEIFRQSGAYTLIVVQFKNKHFLRVTVKPSLKVAYSPELYRSPGFWRDRGISLTYEEKEFLERTSGELWSIDEIIRAVEQSDFPGREALAKKMRRSVD